MGFVGSWEGDPAFTLPVTDTNIIRGRVSCLEPMQHCPGVSRRRRSSIEMPPVEKTPPEMEAAFKGQVLSGVQGILKHKKPGVWSGVSFFFFGMIVLSCRSSLLVWLS